MAEIISISLNGKMLAELDRLKTEMGFTGRSEIIRSALRQMAQENRKNSRSRGGDTIFVVVYTKSDAFGQIRHEFNRLIKVHLHSHLDGGKCMELMVASGDSRQMARLSNALMACKGVETVKRIQV